MIEITKRVAFGIMSVANQAVGKVEYWFQGRQLTAEQYRVIHDKFVIARYYEMKLVHDEIIFDLSPCMQLKIAADGTCEWYRDEVLHSPRGPAIERLNGDQEWYVRGKRHNTEGPAVVLAEGSKQWFLEGVPFSESQFELLRRHIDLKSPTLKIVCNADCNMVFYPDSADTTRKVILYRYKEAIQWFLNDDLHRDGDLPAKETVDGSKEWRRHGKLHRTNGPALVCADGMQQWCQYGKLHREGGPARIYGDGREEWWLNDQRHRVGGPAMYGGGPDEVYFFQGQLHRDDGPAIVSSQVNIWYVRGILHRTDGPAIECANGGNEWHVDGLQLTKEEFEQRQRKMQFLRVPIGEWTREQVHTFLLTIPSTYVCADVVERAAKAALFEHVDGRALVLLDTVDDVRSVLHIARAGDCVKVRHYIRCRGLV